MSLGEVFQFKRQAIIYLVILSILPYHSSFYLSPKFWKKKTKTKNSKRFKTCTDQYGSY